MPPMKGLTLLVHTDDIARFRAGLAVALAYAALGGSARIYCHEASVTLLARTIRDADRAMPPVPTAPDRLALIAMAREAAIPLIACQTGLAVSGLALADLADGVEAGGLVSLMAAAGEDRLLSI